MMISPILALRIAFNNLRRGGQRIAVAFLCVAFGVMSLVAMTLLSSAIEKMFVIEPHDLIGADISMDRRVEDAILPQDIKTLEEMRQEGVLQKYSLVAYTSSLTFRLPGSSELYFPNAGIGINPSDYPPIGALTVESPNSAGLPDLLAGEGDVLISRDLALEYHLSVGDTLLLSDLAAGTPLEARIRGIIIDTPNHYGSKLYYSLATASRLAGSDRHLNTVLVATADPAALKERLEKLGWNVFLADSLAEDQAQVRDFFVGLLNGAGVLGLLVSGVGIANTMQVLLRRRQREVAVWKSIGYRSSDLMAMFSLEAGLLGLLGSLLGAGLGIAVSAGLVNLFSRTSTMLVQWVLSPEPVLLAILVGVATTVIFALWAIVTTSQLRPVVLLRGETASPAKLPAFLSLLLFLGLALPFTALVVFIMGSWIYGIGVLLAAGAGLIGLGGGLGILLWLVTRLIPWHFIPVFSISRSSLRRRGLAPIFALVSLFIGVVALMVSTVVVQNAERVVGGVDIDLQGYNLNILAHANQQEAIMRMLEPHAAKGWSVGYNTTVRAVNLAGNPEETFSPLLAARTNLFEYSVSGAPWGSRPDGVYISGYAQVPPDSSVEVTLWDGTVHRLPVVGAFQMNLEQPFHSRLGILLPTELSLSMTPPDQVQIFARIPAGRLASVARALGEELPQATVMNLVAYAARFTSQYHNLFVFAVSMASLALLAGVLLMANSVSLAVLDRRYEIGVLKAMGYSQWHILVTLMVEYALIALVAAGAGLLLVRGFLWVVGMQNPLAANLLIMTPAASAAVLLFTLGLTFFAIYAATWKPIRVSPLVVLNDRI